MAAIQRTRISSFGAGVFVVAISAAMLAGAGGGYMVRAVTSHESTSAPAVHRTYFADPSQDVTQSDLTRVQPADRSTAAVQLPDWVQAYIAPAAKRAFRIDEYLESLSYAGTANAGSAAAAPALQFQP